MKKTIRKIFRMRMSRYEASERLAPLKISIKSEGLTSPFEMIWIDILKGIRENICKKEKK